MTAAATRYNVRFVNNIDVEDGGEPIVVNFSALDPTDVKSVISALSAYYSGDPCECFINGQEAVLDRDWGLMEPTATGEG